MSKTADEMASDPLAGIELDVGAAGLEAVALLEIHKTLRGIRADYARFAKLETDYEKEGPVFVPLQGQVTLDAAGDPAFIDLGGPAYGREWLVRQMVCGGISWATAASGSGLILAQANPPAPLTAPGLANIQDAFTTMPGVHFYSSSQFRIRNPIRIFFVVTGGTGLQNYQIFGDAYDSPDGGVPTVATE